MKANFSFQKRRAFTVIELLVVIVAVSVLATFLLSARANDKAIAQQIQCINNLKQVGLSFRVWAGDYENQFPSHVSTNKGGSMEYVAGGNAFRHFLCMSNELSTPKILVCPADTREAAKSFAALKNANVSYFVGVDAALTKPQTFLAGDHNLVIDEVPVKSGLVTVKSTNKISWTEELHNVEGNVGLANGSVQATSSARLQQMSARAGTSGYRLALP